jgi:hypothetical protein
MGADVFWTPQTRVFLPLPDAPPHSGFFRARDGRNFISRFTCTNLCVVSRSGMVSKQTDGFLKLGW